jgi:hypothetical protein
MYLLLNHDKKNLKHDKNHPLHITQTKTMAVVTRMMKNVSSQVTAQFLCLLEVDDATALGLCTSLKKFFQQQQILPKAAYVHCFNSWSELNYCRHLQRPSPR